MKMRTSLAVSTLALSLVLAALAVAPLMAQDWPMFGQNLSNTASTSGTDISNKTVYKLMPKWAFTTAGDVSARAAVVNGVAYFPDWAGNLYAVNTSNGKLVWSHQFSDYYALNGGVPRHNSDLRSNHEVRLCITLATPRVKLVQCYAC